MNEKKKFKRLPPHPMPLCDAITPPSRLPEVRYIDVRGREEHEAIIRDASWCKELGIDQAYEVAVYLKRWGAWLTKD